MYLCYCEEYKLYIEAIKSADKPWKNVLGADALGP